MLSRDATLSEPDSIGRVLRPVDSPNDFVLGNLVLEALEDEELLQDSLSDAFGFKVKLTSRSLSLLYAQGI